MCNNGDILESHFIKLIHEWYEACDERGIMPEKCVNRWINLHNFLVQGINFEDPLPPGSHIKRIPCITYEGLLQCISTRINLYRLSET